MKKGTKICTVVIDGATISAFDQDGQRIKLTRAQRYVLMSYKRQDYISEIEKVFDNDRAVGDSLTIVHNGKERIIKLK